MSAHGSKKVQGMLRVRLQLHHERERDLRVTIVEAQDVHGSDLNGLSDPYAECVLCDDVGNPIPGCIVRKTRRIKKTLSPYWNEVIIVGQDQGLDVESLCLKIQIFDHDDFGKDDHLGFVVISMWALGLSVHHPKDMWVPIQYKKPAALSEVFGRWKFAEKAKATLTRRIVDHLDENLKKVAKQIAWKPASDPAMPLGAKKAFEHIIGGLMIEVNAFIMSQLKAVLHVHAVSNWQTSNEQSASSLDEHVFGISCYEICNISVFNHLVAWFRYKNYPADKDIWSQLYDPWFWIFRIICVWPTPGPQTVFFILKFVTMEQRDDFQLIHYIAEFKALQLFVSIVSMFGLVRGYYRCAVNYEAGGDMSCASDGPGIADICGNYYNNDSDDRSDSHHLCNTTFPIVDFACKILLINWAYHKLQYSTSMGGKLFCDSRLKGCRLELSELDPTISKQGHFERALKKLPPRMIKQNAYVIEYHSRSGKHEIAREMAVPRNQPPRSNIIRKRPCCFRGRIFDVFYELPVCYSQSIPGRPSKSGYTTHFEQANKEEINLNRVRWKIISMPGAACSPMSYLMAYDHCVILLLVAFFGFLTSFNSSFKWDDSEGQQLYGYNRYWKMETEHRLKTWYTEAGEILDEWWDRL